MELSSDTYLSLPVMGSVLITKFIADVLSPPPLDAMISSSRYLILTHLTQATRKAVIGRTAGEFVDSRLSIIRQEDSLEEIQQILQASSSQMYFPVIAENNICLGGFSRPSAIPGFRPGFDDEFVQVDERFELIKCLRLVRDLGMKRLVITNHRTKAFKGVIERNAIAQILKYRYV
jgi:hypothetical protein